MSFTPHPSYATSREGLKAGSHSPVSSAYLGGRTYKIESNGEHLSTGEFRCCVKFLFECLLSFETDKDVNLSVLALLFNEGAWYSGPELLLLVSLVGNISFLNKIIIFVFFMGSSLIHTKLFNVPGVVKS